MPTLVTDKLAPATDEQAVASREQGLYIVNCNCYYIVYVLMSVSLELAH